MYMKASKFILIFGILLSFGCASNNQTENYLVIDIGELVVFPTVMDFRPGVKSPVITKDQRVFVLAGFEGGVYSWLDVTVENGDERNYKKQLYGKGNQLLPDKADFPHFAATGLHSDKDLSNTLTISGKSVAHITVDGRPLASSGEGFMAKDETVMSVLWGDNKIVKKLRLSHFEIGKVLFHVWNAGWMMGVIKTEHRLNKLFYFNRELSIDLPGSRGWQESIFYDEILGSGHLEVKGKLREEEVRFLKEHYKELTDDEFVHLTQFLSVVHTGDMLPFYVTRYGFYEGHTDYRTDPLAVAFLFGLRTIEEVHKAADGDLYKYFNSHYIKNPEYKRHRLKNQEQRVVSHDNMRAEISTRQPATDSISPAPGASPEEIDSLILVLKSAGHNWNIPADQLIGLGDHSIPGLVALLFDKSEPQWNRRMAAMTLNQIHSPQTVEYALNLLFDAEEEWGLRNQIIPSLGGFNLVEEKDRLWELFMDPLSERYKGNIASLLVYSDTSKAYYAYLDLFHGGDGYMRMQSMCNLAMLRPHESSYWYVEGIKGKDWWTACTAMDSLISLRNIDPVLLIDLFNQPDVSEETRWRVTHIFSKQVIPESLRFLKMASKDPSWLVSIEARCAL